MDLSVPEFYKGKRVLVTGGTGFVGKALIEKLLRSCPDIGAVYLLIRSKKGVSSEERLKDLYSQRVFDLLRVKNPDGFKKIIPVNGDITEHELGISEEDKLELQKNCNIIFHSAACVRFDQKLKEAVHLNTTGTLRVLTLAESMASLQAFVHLSTAYCRCELDVLDEKLYPAVHSPRKIIDIVEWMDDETLAHLEPKIIESEPNTYSYTKAITEELVGEYGGRFPVAIARPSIVTASWKEPMPGWVDNLNGPTGLIVASGKGVIRTMHCEPSYTADAVPVDVVANACVLIGCLTALDRSKDAQVYNLTLSKVIKLTWAEIIKLGEKWVNMYPYSVALWYPGGSIKSYKITHQIDVLLFHIVPAYLVDALLFLLGKKTFMVTLQKRISHGLEVLQYYTTKEWNFTNRRFRGLRDRIRAEDDEVFYTDLSSVAADDYLREYVVGTREYVCNEDPGNLSKSRRLHSVRYVADRIVKLIFFGVLLWFLYSRSHLFVSALGSLDNILIRLNPVDVRTEHVVEV